MQWVIFSGLWYYDVLQVWVIVESNVKQISGFMFILVSVWEQFGEGWYVQVVFCQCYFQYDVVVMIDRNQMVENGKICGR